MQPPGYLRPLQTAPLSDRQEAEIAAACPGLRQHVNAGGRTDSVLWGPYLEMFTGWATDPALRHAASSGGTLSAILTHLLSSGMVNKVIETSADPQQPTGNTAVLTEDAETVQQAAGSRYAPSSPLAALPEYLDEHRAIGTRFALVGKPCDIAAFRVMQAADPALTAAIPITLSFFCAGVPSVEGAGKILDALGIRPDMLASFRYRGNGWPGRAVATCRDGSERAMSYHDSWGGILSKHVQHRCKICADGTGAAADIVCADAWQSDARGYPLFDEAPGISLIVARTALGAQVIAAAQASATLEIRPCEVADLAAIQPGQTGRKRALFARLAGLRLMARPVPHYQGLHLLAAARQNPPLRNLRNFLGMIRRAVLRHR